MRDLAAVAVKLREVRVAKRKFLRLAAIEQSMVTPMLDRLAADVAADDGDGAAGNAETTRDHLPPGPGAAADAALQSRPVADDER
jgi:hypothetical protein